MKTAAGFSRTLSRPAAYRMAQGTSRAAAVFSSPELHMGIQKEGRRLPFGGKNSVDVLPQLAGVEKFQNVAVLKDNRAAVCAANLAVDAEQPARERPAVEFTDAPIPCTYTLPMPRWASSASPLSAQTRSSSENAVSPSRTSTAAGGISRPSAGTAASSDGSARLSPSRFSQLTVSVAVPIGPPVTGSGAGRSSHSSAAAAASRMHAEKMICFFGIGNLLRFLQPIW